LNKIRELINKIKGFTRTYIYLKVFVVFLAFFVMILSSCLIMNNTMGRKLTEHVETSISDAKAFLENSLTSPKVSIDFIADNIEGMIKRGEDIEAVQAQIRFYTSDTFKERIENFTFNSVYGFFDIFDEFYEGSGWIPSEGFIPRERPWYTAAVEEYGNVAISPVYIDVVTNAPVLSYARCLFDNDGKLLGVISMDVPVSFINQILDSTITDNSYGFIADERSLVITHPSETLIGTVLADNNPFHKDIIDNVRNHDGITRTHIINYEGIKTILFSSMTFNGWYVNFVVPEAEYYRDLYYLMSVVSVLGFAMALMLSILLVRIESARTESELVSRKKSTFLANMSHEIRTPMNSIIGFSELALDDDVSPKTKHYLRSIVDNAKWLLNIINDILDNSKIESGKVILEHIPYDLQDVVSQCQSAILPKAAEKGLALYCYAEPLNNKTLMGDPVRLRQVFMNLLSNAVKFTNSGTVKLLSSVRSLGNNKAIISFEIKDSGIGMTDEQVSNIFVPFMQADDTVTRKFGGTGLGLPITKSIIELMGGKLAVESKVGSGSVFSFDLTFDTLDGYTATQPFVATSSMIERPNFEGEVLICEDNGLNQQVICEHLSRVGLKTVLAQNGLEGVNLVTQRIEKATSGNYDGNYTAKKPFELIFMDIHIPVMDGLEAASVITNMEIETPIIALTANIMSNDLEQYNSSGMHDYLGKPFTTQDLWKCLLKYFKATSYTEVAEETHNEEEDEALRQLSIYFVKANQDTFNKIKTALEDGPILLAHRLAHTLKGNAGQIRKKKLQEAAATIEDYIVKEDLSAARSHMDRLAIELQNVLDELAPLLADADKRNQEKITDPEKVQLILRSLEPMLEKRNPECMNLVDDLYAIPGAEQLAQYVEDFEFKKAIDELKAFREN